MAVIKKEFSGKRMAFPLIGAGLAGGDWNILKKIISEELFNEDVTIIVWENDTENVKKMKRM